MHALMGKTVTDKVHGFKGVVTGHVSYITGCDQVLVQPPMKKDGTVPDARWIDVQRLEVDKKAKAITLDNDATPGPDMPAPIR